MRYKNVLLVTDLREDSDIVASRAKCMLEGTDAKLRVLHVMEETVLTAGYEIVPIIPISNEDEIISGAREKLQLLLARHKIVADDAHVETALSTRRGILDYCEKINHDHDVIVPQVRTGLARTASPARRVWSEGGDAAGWRGYSRQLLGRAGSGFGAGLSLYSPGHADAFCPA